jgi:hypothetical protein
MKFKASWAGSFFVSEQIKPHRSAFLLIPFTVNTTLSPGKASMKIEQ